MSRFERRVRRSAAAKLAREKVRQRDGQEPRLRLAEAMHAVDRAATLGRSMKRVHARQKGQRGGGS